MAGFGFVPRMQLVLAFAMAKVLLWTLGSRVWPTSVLIILRSLARIRFSCEVQKRALLSMFFV
jgi:hypothetical protein